jgi:hypothetical protein
MMNEFNPDGKDIRFIDSHYRDLFRIPDGGTIQVHYSDDSVVIKPCKFIDEYHVKELVSLLRRCSNNLNQYAKRANETGNIYESDIRDLQERLEEIWTDMKEVLVCLSSIQ